jgi:hypothetical protein
LHPSFSVAFSSPRGKSRGKKPPVGLKLVGPAACGGPRPRPRKDEDEVRDTLREPAVLATPLPGALGPPVAKSPPSAEDRDERCGGCEARRSRSCGKGSKLPLSSTRPAHDAFLLCEYSGGGGGRMIVWVHA